MPAFTLPLKDVIKYTGGNVEIVSGLRRITNSAIGLEHYPIYDNSYRQTLNGKIIDHYWNREIGQESVDLFIHALRRKMNEIMPPYNLLYKSTQLEFDPLKTIDMQTVANSVTRNESEATSTNNTESNSNTNAASNSRSVNSDFPQTMLSDNGDYATSAADATGTTTSGSTSEDTGTASQSGTEDGTASNDSRVTGYQGLPSDMLMRYRESIINVDMMIINELEDLFMGIWDNSDSYTPSEIGWYY